ncbi:unnamed protein product [Caenorhabditis brenneri]
MSSFSTDLSSSMDLPTVQAALKQRNEEFKVLTEQFLKQRMELYAAKKTDSNREYVNFLEEKLQYSLDEIVKLRRMEREEKMDSNAERIQIRLEQTEKERDEKIDESYQTMLQIEFLLAKLAGKAEISTLEEFMKSKTEAKNDITSESVKTISERLIGEAIGLVETQKTEVEDLKKELSDTRKTAEKYKERALKAEDSLRFEALLTREIQQKVNGITESLETHKKLIAELKEEKEMVETTDEIQEQDEEMYDDEEEEEEEYDDEEEDYEEDIQFED